MVKWLIWPSATMTSPIICIHVGGEQWATQIVAVAFQQTHHRMHSRQASPWLLAECDNNMADYMYTCGQVWPQAVGHSHGGPLTSWAVALQQTHHSFFWKASESVIGLRNFWRSFASYVHDSVASESSLPLV